jgi:hypothetical protein
MRQIKLIMGVLLLLMLAGPTTADEQDTLAAALQQVVEESLAAYNSENVAATLRLVHTKSPAYDSMQATLPNQFNELDPRTELVSFRFIGHDDEFAVARVQLKTVAQPGEAFANNVLDTITMFHQENGVWKYWSHHVLGARLVE